MIGLRLVLLGVIFFWGAVILAARDTEPFQAIAASARYFFKYPSANYYLPPKTEKMDRAAREAITGRLELPSLNEEK